MVAVGASLTPGALPSAGKTNTLVAPIRHIDVAAGIQRDADGSVRPVLPPLMVAVGASLSGPVLFPAPERQTRWGVTNLVRHIDVAAGIQRDAVWELRPVLHPLMVAVGASLSRPDAAVPQRRIDQHAGGVVRHIDVAAGIQRDADRVGQAGVAPADGGDGGVVERPLLSRGG